MVAPLRNMGIRHVFVFLGSLLFYLIAALRLPNIKIKNSTILLCLLLLSLLLFQNIFKMKAFSFELIYNCMNFISFFILMTTKSNFTTTEKELRWIFHFSIIIAITMFITSFTSAAYYFEDGRNTGALVLGMTNPNLTAMMISGYFNVIAINFKRSKRKIMLLIILLALMYLMVLTGARSSILASALVLLYMIVFSNVKIPQILIVAPVVFSILFSPIYLNLYKSGFNNIKFLGSKSFFSGREIVYEKIFSCFDNIGVLLFGDLDSFKFSNAHNAPLTIVASLGIICGVVVYHYFTNNLMSLNKSANTPLSRISIVCILGVYIQSSTESLMFTGTFPSITFMYIYLMLAENTNEYMIRDQYGDNNEKSIVHN